MDLLFFEKQLVRTILTNSELREKTIPYLTQDIFEKTEHKKIFSNLISFFKEYSRHPSVAELKIFIDNESIEKSMNECIESKSEEFSEDFIKEHLEMFIKKKLVWKDVAEVIEFVKGEGALDKASGLPDKLRESFTFSFDNSVGYSFRHDAERMYDFLHCTEKYIPTKIRGIDSATEGGLQHKSLTLFMGASGIGKTTIMCGLASNMLIQNKKVLYVTLEMPEEKINAKIMSNLMDVGINDLKRMSKAAFMMKYNSIVQSLDTELIIKEYPATAFNANKLRSLLNELKNKRKFTPEVVFVDYIGIMSPNGTMKDANVNYKYKSISEELAGVASEYDIALVSAAQTNRGGFSAEELTLTDVSDSIGMIATCALVIGISQSEEMKAMGQYNLKILKNRYGENLRRFSIGIDYDKMRIYDIKDENYDYFEEDLDKDTSGGYISSRDNSSNIDFGD